VLPELRAQAYPRVGQLGQQRWHRQPPEPAPSAVPDGGDDDGAQEARGARGVVAGSEGLDEGLREAGADEAADLSVRWRWRKREGKWRWGEVEVEERPTFLQRGFFSSSSSRFFFFFSPRRLSSTSCQNPPLKTFNYRDDVSILDVGDGLCGAENAQGRRRRGGSVRG